MMETRQLLEEAIKALDRLIKAGRFYPTTHPALAAATDETLASFRALVADRETFVFSIRRESILFEEKPLSAENPAITKLATLFFSRRINRLLIQADVTAADITAFVRCLALDPATVQEQGGIRETLLRERVTTIWTNEIDMEEILAKREELAQDEEPAEPEASIDAGAADPGQLDSTSGDDSPADESFAAEEVENNQGQAVQPKTLVEIIQALRDEQDDGNYCVLLQELPEAVTENLAVEQRDAIFQSLALVCRTAGEQATSELRRQAAQRALNALCTPELFDYLIDIVCDKSLPVKVQEYAQKIIIFLKEQIARRVMQRLVDAEDASDRRIMTTLLTRFGKISLPIVIEYLHDGTWYVVRNAVVILADLRFPEVIPKLASVLNHEDVRVRREVLRGLTKIGGDQAVEILLDTLSSGDDDLRRQALLSLGAMRNVTALPSLLRLLGDVASMLKSFEFSKGVIRALGEIGAPEAVPHLVYIATAKKFWGRGQLDDLRAAAVQSLGEIRCDEARLAVEAALDDRAPNVSQAAHQALKILKKNGTR